MIPITKIISNVVLAAMVSVIGLIGLGTLALFILMMGYAA
jgi:hypothetical protein